jgi:hypothetical protein
MQTQETPSAERLNAIIYPGQTGFVVPNRLLADLPQSTILYAATVQDIQD